MSMLKLFLISCSRRPRWVTFLRNWPDVFLVWKHKKCNFYGHETLCVSLLCNTPGVPRTFFQDCRYTLGNLVSSDDVFNSGLKIVFIYFAQESKLSRGKA